MHVIECNRIFGEEHLKNSINFGIKWTRGCCVESDSSCSGISSQIFWRVEKVPSTNCSLPESRVEIRADEEKKKVIFQ